MPTTREREGGRERESPKYRFCVVGVRFIYILHEDVKWPMMVIVWVFTPYSKGLFKCFRIMYCLHLQDDSLIQADAEVTV